MILLPFCQIGRISSILILLALILINLVCPLPAHAESLYFVAGDGVSFRQYSTRLNLKQSSYSMNVNGGTRPYSFSMTNPIVTIEPSYPGAQVSFNVIPKTVGVTILTVKDTKGNSINRELVVFDPGLQPLTLSALPSAAQPVAVGQGVSFTVSGGKAPYAIVSANPGIARVEPRTLFHYVWGVAAGTTQIIVTDASGVKVQGTVHVGTSKPLSITADDTLLAAGKGELTIQSGNPPYTVTTSSHLSASLKGNDSYGRTIYTLAAKSVGQGTVTVKDANGLTASRTVTVKESVILSFPDLTEGLRVIDVGQATQLIVTGGRSPYTVTADKPIVTIQQQGNGQYSVKGLQAGIVGIIAKDASGTARELSLTVRNLPTLTLAAPETLSVGASGNLSLIGGVAPFAVSASGNQIALTKVEEKKYTIVAKVPGRTTITVKDAKGTTVQKAVNILAPPLKLEIAADPLLVGHTRPLDIKGGVGPYTLTLSNSSAKAAINMTTPAYTRYNITGIAPGAVDITAKDSLSTTAVIRLIVQALPANLKILVSSNTLQIPQVGSPSIRVLTVQGGVAPYTVTVSGNQIALTQVSANQYQMIPRTRGTAVITVKDSKGQTANQSMIVQ